MPLDGYLGLHRVEPETGLGLDVQWGSARAAAPAADQFVWFERFVALALLILTLPILATAALVVALLSRRTPLIAHARVGQHGKVLWMLKLRTMWGRPGRQARRGRLIERIDGERPRPSKTSPDTRVTSRFAALCRKHSIDELPQLWHVVAGEMSLVGPRPMTKYELSRWYGADVPEVLRRKPGLTGLWQVGGRDLLTYSQRKSLDLFLVRNLSWKLYLTILISTIPSLITGRNAS